MLFLVNLVPKHQYRKSCKILIKIVEAADSTTARNSVNSLELRVLYKRPDVVPVISGRTYEL